MNAATIVIGLVEAALLGLAIRYLVKNGACAACGDREACEAARKGTGAKRPPGCGGNCASCKYYQVELKATAGKR